MMNHNLKKQYALETGKEWYQTIGSMNGFFYIELPSKEYFDWLEARAARTLEGANLQHTYGAS